MSQIPAEAPKLVELHSILDSTQRTKLLSLISHLLETHRRRLHALSHSHLRLNTHLLNAHDLYAEATLRKLSALLKTRELPPPPASPPAIYLSPDTAPSVLFTLLTALSTPHYDARTRVLFLQLLLALHIPASYLDQLEAALPLSTTPPSAEHKPESSSSGNKWKIALAGTAGALVIGATGGLATPFVAAGLGVFGLGGLASTAAVMTGFGYYGAKKASEIARRATAGLGEFELIPLTPGPAPRTTIAVAGWVRDNHSPAAEMVDIWRFLDAGESYAVKWETEVLTELGIAVQGVLFDAAVGFAGKQALSRTILAGLASAVMLPLALVKAARVVDNPYSLALNRAKLAGKALAKVLMEETRPVTLVGVSMGAAVVFECCRILAGEEGGKGLGRVENLVLVGAAVGRNAGEWKMVRSAVAGRVVNVFSTEDWVLGFLGRVSGTTAGMGAVNLPGVENVDVSDRIEGHLKYSDEIEAIVGEVLGGRRKRKVEMRENMPPPKPPRPSKEKVEEMLLDFAEDAPGKQPVTVKKGNHEGLLMLQLGEETKKLAVAEEEKGKVEVPLHVDTAGDDETPPELPERPKRGDTGMSAKRHEVLTGSGGWNDEEHRPVRLVDNTGKHGGTAKLQTEQGNVPLGMMEETSGPFMIHMVDNTAGEDTAPEKDIPAFMTGWEEGGADEAEFEDHLAKIERELEERRRRKALGQDQQR